MTLGHPNMLADVRKFQEKFGILCHDRPVHLTKRKLKERVEFLLEELLELTEACGLEIWQDNDDDKLYVDEHPDDKLQDLAGQADALVDLVYVALGTAIMLGLPWDRLWDDVQRANMAKIRGIGHRGHQVDCIKPVGWEGPKTKAILFDAGYDDRIDNRPENHKDDCV